MLFQLWVNNLIIFLDTTRITCKVNEIWGRHIKSTRIRWNTIYYNKFAVDWQLFLLERLWTKRRKGDPRGETNKCMPRLIDMNITMICYFFLNKNFLNTFTQQPFLLIWNPITHYVIIWNWIPSLSFFLVHFLCFLEGYNGLYRKRMPNFYFFFSRDEENGSSVLSFCFGHNLSFFCLIFTLFFFLAFLDSFHSFFHSHTYFLIRFLFLVSFFSLIFFSRLSLSFSLFFFTLIYVCSHLIFLFSFASFFFFSILNNLLLKVKILAS